MIWGGVYFIGHFTRMRCALYTIGIILLLSLGIESVRCTEIRKVPGIEIDDNSEAPLGRPDYIWLPVKYINKLE